MADITLRVNGATCTGSPEARKTLADFLRDDLNLTGTHVGCELGVCGACTVIVDGRAHRPAVDDDRARTADPVLAADVGASEIEVIPEEVRQRLARLRRTCARRAVDPQGDVRHQSLPLAAFPAAARRPRRTTAAATVFR